MMKIVNSRKKITIGVILILLGMGILTSNYFSIKKAKVFDSITLAISELPTSIEKNNETPIVIEEPTEEEVEETTPEITTKKEYITPNEYYIGKLEIPKINFSRGFASINSKYNNVNRNIAIMKTSAYPNIAKGNFILAAHSGNNWNSFFTNLYKLKVEDVAYVHYNNIKYTYTISKIYTEPKTGTIKIYRDRDKTTMTLITCTRNSSTKQTIYILNQTKTETY